LTANTAGAETAAESLATDEPVGRLDAPAEQPQVLVAPEVLRQAADHLGVGVEDVRSVRQLSAPILLGKRTTTTACCNSPSSSLDE
jgi:hypothetical protein